MHAVILIRYIMVVISKQCTQAPEACTRAPPPPPTTTHPSTTRINILSAATSTPWSGIPKPLNPPTLMFSVSVCVGDSHTPRIQLSGGAIHTLAAPQTTPLAPSLHKTQLYSSQPIRLAPFKYTLRDSRPTER